MRKENCSIFPSKSIKRIRESNEYFRIILEYFLLYTNLNKTLKKKKITRAIGIYETMKKKPPFYMKLFLSQPSMYFLPFLKFIALIIYSYEVPINEKNVSERKVAYVPFWFNIFIIPFKNPSQ